MKIKIRGHTIRNLEKATALAEALRTLRAQLRDTTAELYKTLYDAIRDPDGFDYMIGHLYWVTGDMDTIAEEIDLAVIAHTTGQEAQKADKVLVDKDAA